MTSSRPARRFWRGLAVAFLAAIGLAVVSFLWPRSSDFRSFDGREMGRLEARMWRSYYERAPVRLFWQLTRSLREQFELGFVRSVPTAYQAARAAFVFKDGRSRADYQKALPALERYFGSINRVAAQPFDVGQAARDELEWWIIRREPAVHPTADWERLVAEVGANLYHEPPARLAQYARLRVAAMVLRDHQGAAITEQDWQRITELLESSWDSLATVLRRAPTQPSRFSLSAGGTLLDADRRRVHQLDLDSLSLGQRNVPAASDDGIPGTEHGADQNALAGVTGDGTDDTAGDRADAGLLDRLLGFALPLDLEPFSGDPISLAFRPELGEPDRDLRPAGQLRVLGFDDLTAQQHTARHRAVGPVNRPDGADLHRVADLALPSEARPQPAHTKS
jgi:hypothetical protein